MTTYIIKNEENIEINRINASLDFVEQHYPGSYEVLVASPDSDETISLIELTLARKWRDEELDATDAAANTLDWPNRTNILAYRVLLRDWPSTEDFPATQPTMPTE